MNEIIIDLLPFLIPFAMIQAGLWLGAIIHIFKSKSFRVGNRLLWFLISFITIIGPVLYFVIGRSEKGGE